MMRIPLLPVFALAAALSLPTAARAEAPEAQIAEASADTDARPGGPRLDVEIDPLAWALGGHSVHAGARWGRLRVDLGAFGLPMPEALSGNPGFTARFDGVGAKADWALREDGMGPFAGIEGSYTRLAVAPEGGDAFTVAPQGNAGVRVGWRIPVYKGLYVAPWVGVGANLGAREIATDGGAYEVGRAYVFPTIHLGYVGR